MCDFSMVFESSAPFFAMELHLEEWQGLSHKGSFLVQCPPWLQNPTLFQKRTTMMEF